MVEQEALNKVYIDFRGESVDNLDIKNWIFQFSFYWQLGLLDNGK